MKKKQIISTLLFCLMIGLIVASSFALFAYSKEGKYPFNEQIIMANHNDVEIKNVDSIKPNDDGEITIDQLNSIPNNSKLGKIEYNDNSAQIIYNCNDVSLIDTVTLIDKGDYIGQIGCAKIYGYRANLAEFMKIECGQTVNITMPYGEYVYKCVQKDTAKSDWDASRQNYNVSRGLILYSDKGGEYGFSNEYDVAVFEMLSGPKIVG